jgi:membrane protein
MTINQNETRNPVRSSRGRVAGRCWTKRLAECSDDPAPSSLGGTGALAKNDGQGQERVRMGTIPVEETRSGAPAPVGFARQFYAACLRLNAHDGLTVAGYMAFAAFTSLFPFLIFLAALASVLGTHETAQETVEGLFLFMPKDVAETLAPAVHQVMAGHHGGLLTIGVLATLWTASSGIEALREALDRAYGVTELAPIWWRRLQSMALVVAGSLILFVASLAVILGPVLWRMLEVFGRPSEEEEVIWTIGRYLLGAVVLAVGLIGLHRWLPNRRLPLRALFSGVALTLILWLVGASLFSLYLGTVADYSVTYGSLAGVAITLLFFYLTGALFILGAEYNAVRLETAER